MKENHRDIERAGNQVNTHYRDIILESENEKDINERF